MLKRRKVPRAGVGVNKRNTHLADEAWNRCYPLFKAASDSLAKVVEDGHGPSSKRWGGQYLTEVYSIARRLPAHRAPELVHQDFQLMLGPVSNNPESRNLLNLVINALEDENGLQIGKRRRSEFANALSYAWKHSIPQPLVHGFILQVGGVKSAARKNIRNERELWSERELPWLSLIHI